MIEDQQRQIETKMNIAQAEREAAIAEEAQASMAVSTCANLYVCKSVRMHVCMYV